MDKLKQFKRRNQRRNAHLYSDKLLENIDYITCPVSNERLSMIKSSYIERVLEMSITEYDRLYPGVRGVSMARKTNIKKGLHQTDATGLTAYQRSQVTAQVTLSQLDENGISGYAKKGQKTRETHMNNIDQFGRNGYSQLATLAIIKGNTTKAMKGIILDPSQRNEFYRYKAVVTYITEQHRSEITDGYKTGLAGVKGAYHIDHIFSIMQGYKASVSPLLIGSNYNLQMMPWKENLSKHGSCNITLTALLEKANYTLDRSLYEFKIFANMINNDMQIVAPVSGAKLVKEFNESNIRK